MDVYLQHANGQNLWANRLNIYGPGEVITDASGNTLYSGRRVMVAAGNMEGSWSRIRFQGRKGAFNLIVVGFQDHVLAQNPNSMHSDNVIGDPASLSDARLKNEVTSVSGTQALSVLSQIRGCTYERPDLQERRLGLIADDVEDAIDQLAIDNVVGSKWHDSDEYKTLDYSRLVALLIPAVNTLSERVKDLETKINGAT